MFFNWRLIGWKLFARYSAGINFGRFHDEYGIRKIKNAALFRYEKETIQKLCEYKFDVLLDVGANIGLFSVCLDRASKVDGRVIKFVLIEPDLRLLPLLQHNTKTIESMILPIGCGAFAELTNFFRHRNPLVNSLSPGLSVVGSRPIETSPVPIFSIDEVVARTVDAETSFAVKIDIEGSDLMVIETSKFIRSERCKALVVEWSEATGETINGFIDRLSTLGFTSFQRADESFGDNGSLKHVNFVCRK
jgi:FkbM family methyltransferase